MSKSGTKRWVFASRFRRSAFGWKSQPAMARVKEAVSEIRKAARTDPILGADGAVLFLEKVSPALEHVDSSSGAIGSAVNHAIRDLVPLIANAPADAETRASWLDRLWAAHEADEIPYIEQLADHWGALCGSEELASIWADRLLGATRMALTPDRKLRHYFHGSSACFSALFHAGRYDEIVELLNVDTIWSYKVWAVKALSASGRKADAIRYAESCRDRSNTLDIDSICEELLLSSGLMDEAYERYGLTANRAGTNVSWFRNVCRKYPGKLPTRVLTDLIAITPGDEGKWFAAAKSAGLYEEATRLARSSRCDPRTLTRAARDFAETNPNFATEVGLAALHWLVQGHGYEITAADVLAAYAATLNAAERNGTTDASKVRIRQMVATEAPGRRFVAEVLGRELELQ